MSFHDGTPARVFLRPIGSPVPLGLSGLVGASLVLSGLELGWLAGSQQGAVGIVLLAFAFPLQFSASLLAFAARDGVLGAALGILAGTWLTTGLIYVGSGPGSRSGALGLLLLAATVVLASAAAAAATGKLAPALVFMLASLRFALSGVYELGGGTFWQDAAGIVGLVIVALAAYTMAMAALEDARGTPMPALGRRARGESALAAPFREQVAGVEHEPGVRQQL